MSLVKQALPTRHDYMSLHPVSVGVVLSFFLFFSCRSLLIYGFVHVLVPSDFTWWNEWSGYKYSNTEVNANSHRKPEVVSGASWKAQIDRLINDTNYVIIIIFKQNHRNRNIVPIDNTDMFRLLVVKIPNQSIYTI